MRVTIRGRRWELKFVRGLTDHGRCDAPNMKGTRILIRKGLSEEKELDTLIHEYLHAANWDFDEEAVTESAAGLAKLLMKLGWRRTSHV